LPAIVDTTVLVEVAQTKQPTLDRTKNFAASKGPALRVDYAMRELLAGPVRQLCTAHNRVLAAENPAEAVVTILQGAGFAARTRTGEAKAVAEAMSKALKPSGSVTSDGLRREVLQSLAIEANSLWRRAQGASFLEEAQPLACFPRGSLSFDPTTRALRGPNDSLNCLSSERCSAAQYLYQNKADLEALIAALHPSALGAELASKRENQSRRAALKELLAKGPVAFSKRKCRALGDAYFAVMAPPGYAVLTTNMVDYKPLCQALRKQAIQP
jgi:hypothetical protein